MQFEDLLYFFTLDWYCAQFWHDIQQKNCLSNFFMKCVPYLYLMSINLKKKKILNRIEKSFNSGLIPPLYLKAFRSKSKLNSKGHKTTMENLHFGWKDKVFDTDCWNFNSNNITYNSSFYNSKKPDIAI